MLNICSTYFMVFSHASIIIITIIISINVKNSSRTMHRHKGKTTFIASFQKRKCPEEGEYVQVLYGTLNKQKIPSGAAKWIWK